MKEEKKIVSSIELRDYFAAQAMESVMSETQEMRVASFFDFIKLLLQQVCYLSFLEVQYIEIKGVYQKAAERC